MKYKIAQEFGLQPDADTISRVNDSFSSEIIKH